ncbi:NAD(P)-dependent oxidoreductase [Isoptericola cucumis]|uniref:Dehydrogenase n=2 Tax=Isoptericola cucumis TaxID=1776856 RepID=A0ABQ2B811_9MICO|nr:NAD(P)-dependent oxidoreductase [Isoptericola cucumis]GGI08223.1 dehydrogenase [Isoptericola cucumis]
MQGTTIGFVGLGPMGAPMARNLLGAGFDVALWNRTASKAQAVAGDHPRATVATTPAEAARPVVVAMLPDLPQVRDVVERADGLRAGWRAAGVDDPLLVVMSTVSPVAVREWARDLAADGVRLVDAPVSGGVEGAAAGTLSIMAGGADADVALLGPVFDALGRTVRHLGPVGAGSLTKTCNQVVVGGTLNALAEAVAIAEAGGLDLEAVLDVLGGGLAASQLLTDKARRYLTGDFTHGAACRTQLKDLEFGIAAGRELGVATGATEVARDRYQQMVDRGDAELDHSAVVRVVV